MIGNYATFTDYLIAHDVYVHPESVIVNCTDIVNSEWRDTHPTDRCLPPFDHVQVEFQIDYVVFCVSVWRILPEEGPANLRGISSLLYSYTMLSADIRDPQGALVLLSDRQSYIAFQDDGSLDVGHMFLSPRLQAGELPQADIIRLTSLPDDINTQYLVLVNHCFAYLHKEREVELVEYSRQRRRRIQRKTGKEPSPYFMLRVAPERPKKVYAGSNGGGSTGRKALHMVRGHFRRVAGHPFIPDGTYFIRPHTRGSLDKGKIDKGYRVVLGGVEK